MSADFPDLPTVACFCPQYTRTIPKINDAVMDRVLRTKKDYDGDRFRFCPFCGASLTADTR